MVQDQEAPQQASCPFFDSRWNDFTQKNFIYYYCSNSENTGGRAKVVFGTEFHGERTYGDWHKNEGMTYRCFGNPEKIAKCPIWLRFQQRKQKALDVRAEVD